jgi:short-subunit dehydrogenase
MEPSLLGKNIVITGASSGIGKTTALALAAQGANLILAARRELLLNDVAMTCQEFGVEAYSYKTDVTLLDDVNNLFEFALERLGSIDIWINNAGVGAVGEFIKTPMEAHEQVIKTNLIGYMHGAYVSLPYFKTVGAGILINNISLGAFVPTPFASAYTASKFGLKGFTEALRAEMHDQKNLYICDVFPAFIDTPGFEHSANYIGRKLKPLPPVYDPQKVADAVIALCTHPRDKIMVGNSGRLAKVVHAITPKLFGNVMAKFMQTYFKGAPEEEISEGNLFKVGWRNLHPLRLFFKH